MMKSCPYCGGIHEVGVVCKKKPARKPGKHKSKAGDLRHRAIWTRKSIEIRERDLFCCRYCLEHGTVTTRDLSVHHIIPINEDESVWLENDNLITLCYEHHEEAEKGLIDRETLSRLATAEAKVSPRLRRR